MVATAIVTGTFSLGAAAVGGAIAYLTTRQSDERERDRLYHEHTLERKFTALEELHTALYECFRAFRAANVQGVTSMSEFYADVRTPYDDLLEATDHAAMYLGDDLESLEATVETFNAALTYFRSQAQALDGEYMDREVAHDYEVATDELEDAYEAAADVVRERLDPPEVGD